MEQTADAVEQVPGVALVRAATDIAQGFVLVRNKLIEIEEKDRIRNFQPPVSGQEIMETFGIEPSRVVGEIKEVLKNAILDGQIPNQREAAWELMLRVAAEKGLQPVKQAD